MTTSKDKALRPCGHHVVGAMIKAEMMATKGSHLQVFEYMQLFQYSVGFEDTPERGCEEGKIPMSDVQPWSLPRFRFNPSFSLVVSCKFSHAHRLPYLNQERT